MKKEQAFKMLALIKDDKMKIADLIKAFKKEGLKVEKDLSGKYTVIGEKYVCTFYENWSDSTKTFSVNLVEKNEPKKYYNSHYAGFFVDSIKDAVKYLKEV